MARVLTDHVLRRRLSREAREYVQSWSPTIMAKKLRNLYRTVVEELPRQEDASRIDCVERLSQVNRL